MKVKFCFSMLWSKNRVCTSGVKRWTSLNTVSYFRVLWFLFSFYFLCILHYSLPAAPLCKYWWLDALEEEVTIWNIMDLIRIVSDDLVKKILCCKLIILFKNWVYVFLNITPNSLKMIGQLSNRLHSPEHREDIWLFQKSCTLTYSFIDKKNHR